MVHVGVRGRVGACCVLEEEEVRGEWALTENVRRAAHLDCIRDGDSRGDRRYTIGPCRGSGEGCVAPYRPRHSVVGTDETDVRSDSVSTVGGYGCGGVGR